MSTTETVVATPTPSPTATPVTTAPPSSWDTLTNDVFKDAGFTDEEIKAGASEVTPETTNVVQVVAPEVKPADMVPPKDDIDLDAIKDEPVVEPPKPTLTPEQESVLRMYPNLDIAQMGVQGLQLTNAFSRGNVDGVLATLKAVNPQAFEHFEETLYQKRMPGWVDRYIAENDPNANPQQAALSKRLEAMENTLKQAQQQNMTVQQQHQYQQKLTAIDGEVKHLFDAVKFIETNGWDATDRAFVVDAIHKHLATNPQVMGQAMNGNLTVLRPIVREKINLYVQRDKARADKLRATATTQQETKKPPVPAAGVATTSTTATGKDAFFEKAADFVRANA